MSISTTESALDYFPQEYLLPDEGKELPQSPELSRSEAAQTLRLCRKLLDVLGVKHNLPDSLTTLGPDYASQVKSLMIRVSLFFHDVPKLLPALVSYNPRLNCLHQLDLSAPPLENIGLIAQNEDFAQVAEVLPVAFKQAITDILIQQANNVVVVEETDLKATPDLIQPALELVTIFETVQVKNLSWPQLMEIFKTLNQEVTPFRQDDIGRAGKAKVELAVFMPIVILIAFFGSLGLSQVDWANEPDPVLSEKVYTDPDEAKGAMKIYLENNWSAAMNLAFQGYEVTAEVEAMIHGYKEKIIQETLNRITKAVDMEVDFRGKVDLDQTNLNLMMIGPKKDTLEISFPDGYTLEKKLNPLELVGGDGSPELYARVNEGGFLHYLLTFELENPNTTAGYCATLLIERTGQSWRDAEVSINRGSLGDIIADQFDSLDSSEPIARRLAGDGWTPVTQDQDGNVVLLGLEADLYQQAGFMMETLQSKLVEIAESGSIPENSMCLSSPSLRKIHHELTQSSMPTEGMYFETKAGAELQVLAHNWVGHTMKIDETIPIAAGDCGQIFESRRDVGNYLKDYLVTAGTNKKPTIIQIGTSRYLVIGTKQPVLAEDQGKIFIYVVPYEQIIVRGQ